VSRSFLNVAREPYVNTRPVVRLSIALWLVGLLLFAGNIWLYWDFFAGRSGTHAQLAEVEQEIETTRGRIASLESQVAGFDLADQNLRVEYLNTRIDQRHFAWSRLFDALARILPDDVRLTRLTPSGLDDDAKRAARSRQARSPDAAETDQRVVLQIEAVARTNDSILTLVDALFGDEAFEQPNLIRQSNLANGTIQFNIQTIYDPRAGQTGQSDQAGEKGDAAGDGPAPDAKGEGTADPPPAGGDAGGANNPRHAAPRREAQNRRPTRLGPAASSAPEVVR